MKKVIYTCLFGTIDNLHQPDVVDTSFDYVCFSDRIIKESGIWQIKQLPQSISNPIYLSRYPKLLPHLFLSEYDYSLYIDANVIVKDGVFYDKVNEHIKAGDLISQLPHPTRDCIYQELEHCLNIRKVTPLQYIKTRCCYSKNKLPFHYGLFENNVILRKHNNIKVINISKTWWKYFNILSNRDQLSLMLVYWKFQYLPNLLLGYGENTRNSVIIQCLVHSETIKSTVSSHRFLNFITRNSVLPIYRYIVGAEDYQSKW